MPGRASPRRSARGRFVAAMGLARRVRRAVERYASDSVTDDHWWHGGETLEGLCAIASLALARLMRRRGLRGWVFTKGTFHPSSGGPPSRHCWLTHRSGAILDPTACQFSDPDDEPMPRILLAPDGDARYRGTSHAEAFPFWPGSVSPLGRNGQTGRSHIWHVERRLRAAGRSGGLRAAAYPSGT